MTVFQEAFIAFAIVYIIFGTIGLLFARYVPQPQQGQLAGLYHSTALCIGSLFTLWAIWIIL